MTSCEYCVYYQLEFWRHFIENEGSPDFDQCDKMMD